MRVLSADIQGSAFTDLRGQRVAWRHLYDPDDYTAAQRVGQTVRARGGDGIVYDSVRDITGTAIGVFSPRW